MTTKRVMPRFHRRVKVSFREAGSDQTKTLSALTRDVSPTGLALSANRPPRPGTVVVLSIELPMIGRVDLEAKVMWSRRASSTTQLVDSSAFGVQLRSIDERWYGFLAELAAAAH